MDYHEADEHVVWTHYVTDVYKGLISPTPMQIQTFRNTLLLIQTCISVTTKHTYENRKLLSESLHYCSQYNLQKQFDLFINIASCPSL